MKDTATWSAQQIVDSAPFEQWEKERWYASDIGKCPRGVYLARKGEKPTNPPDARSRRIMKMGKKVEDVIVEDYERALHPFIEAGTIKEIRTQQYLIDEKREISGKPDIFIVRNDDMPHLLIEVKSVSSKAFWWMAKQEDPIKPEHRGQNHWYYTRLIEEFKNIEMRVLYVSRDDLTIKELSMDYDPLLEKQTNDFFDMLGEHFKAGTLPPAEPDIIDNPINGLKQVNFKAKFCSHHGLCTGNLAWEQEAEKKVELLNKGVVSYKKRVVKK